MQTITKDELMKLKSGSDIRGTAVETDIEKIQLTDEVVRSVCTAFVRWYKAKFKCKDFRIAVGHDSRISADRIRKAAVSAFCAEGEPFLRWLRKALLPRWWELRRIREWWPQSALRLRAAPQECAADTR